MADNKNLAAAEAVEPRRAAWGKALDALRNHLAH